MITDEQGIKWVLQKLYDSGYRTIETTTMCRIVGRLENGVDIPLLNDCRRLNDAIRNEVIENDGVIILADYLDIVDWSKVPVDTPVLVRDSIDDVWHNRYFASFERNRVYTFVDGCTRWSAKGMGAFPMRAWKEAKLASADGGDDIGGINNDQNI